MALKVVLNSNLDTNEIAKVVIVSENRILLLLRKSDQPFPQHWDLPGGHLRVGETPEQGATRETKEETNLTVENLSPFFKEGRSSYFKTEDFAGNMFGAHELPEHDGYIWLAIEDLITVNNISEKYRKVIQIATESAER